MYFIAQPLLRLELLELVRLIANLSLSRCASLSSLSSISLAFLLAFLRILSTSSRPASYGLSSHLTLFAFVGEERPEVSVF